MNWRSEFPASGSPIHPILRTTSGYHDTIWHPPVHGVLYIGHEVKQSCQKRQKALIESGLHAHWRAPGVSFAPAVSRSSPHERQPRRARLLADGQGHRQHTITIGNIGTRSINRDRQCEFAVIDPNAPFIKQEILDLLQHSA